MFDDTLGELARISKGSCFGELALLRQDARAASVRALTDALVLACHRNDFIQKLGSLADIRHMWRFEALRKVGHRCRVVGQTGVPTAVSAISIQALRHCWRVPWMLAPFAAPQAAVAQQLCKACCWLQVPLLAPLSAAQRSQLCKAFVPQSYTAGSTIVQRGNRGDTFYVIEAGQCTVVNEADQVGPNRQHSRSTPDCHHASLEPAAVRGHAEPDGDLPC